MNWKPPESRPRSLQELTEEHIDTLLKENKDTIIKFTQGTLEDAERYFEWILVGEYDGRSGVLYGAPQESGEFLLKRVASLIVEAGGAAEVWKRRVEGEPDRRWEPKRAT